jgi:hypothetical protein
LSSKQDLLSTSLAFKARFAINQLRLQNKICYQPALSSKQNMLLMRGVDISPQRKKTMKRRRRKKKAKLFSLQLTPYIIMCKGKMLQGSHLSGAEIPRKYDDIELVQLVLTHSG